MFGGGLVLLLCASAVLVCSLDFRFPAENTPENRVLGLILAYNFDHIDPLLLILNEYVSMCEGGWAPTVVLFTVVNWSKRLKRYLSYNTYCYRTASSIPIRYHLAPESISIGLGALHRRVVADELNNFDVFVYHEDDIVFKHTHLQGYLWESKRLHQAAPEDGLAHHCIGFQRYRRLLRTGDIHHTAYGETDIIEQNLLEEMPAFQRICLGDVPYLKVLGNIHQAIWILTKDQVNMLQERCQFLNQSSPSREYMSSFSLFERAHRCGIQKILPAEGLTRLSINHYYQQRHVQWTPVFTSDENLRAGYHFSSRNDEGAVPQCWKDVVVANRLDQEDHTEVAVK